MTESPTTPGEALRALRTAAGLTLGQVAQESGVSISQLSRVETGAKAASSEWIGAVAEAIALHLKSAA